uniref:Cytosolic arginine sensor for mTORC1 subunit 2 n=1 Tax=Cyprinodon variegatus TaxID=28743 RepID=A0A3Q2DS15_CYPVA
MELHILEHSLKVASIEKEGIEVCTHGLIKLAFLASKTRCKFFSLTETPEDYTIIVDEEGFKELPQSNLISVADATWLALNVVSGGGSASSSQPIGVTKIAKSVIAPLADHNISVFMLSTYQTDFILVRERDLPLVMHTLSSEFTLFRVVNGETVAAHNLGVTNGFVKPKLVPRPIIHPLSSPSNMFCVTSLDPDTLPSVATLLMDVMFYSGGSKEVAASGEDSSHIRFFSFSLIEGYISLVMDEQTAKRLSRSAESEPSECSVKRRLSAQRAKTHFCTSTAGRSVCQTSTGPVRIIFSDSAAAALIHLCSCSLCNAALQVGGMIEQDAAAPVILLSRSPTNPPTNFHLVSMIKTETFD